ncbi:hypothetical protein MMC22_000475 [Lobaria immixta]|nr:hypothetical protein [Lobaria immixta]
MSEQSFKKHFKPPSSKPDTSTKVLHDGQANGDSSRSQDLWARAYEALTNRDPDLVAAYANHFAPANYSSTTPPQRTLSPELIENVIKKSLQDNKAKKLVVRLGNESIKLQEQGEKIIKFILWSNDFISAAVNAQPFAALAWSGVSVLFCLLLNSSKQTEAMLTGLNFVTDILRLYKIREEIYRHSVEKPDHSDFGNAIVELYTDILEYQARLIHHLSLSSFKRGIQNTFECHDWSGMLNKVHNSDARCTGYMALFDKEKEHRFYMEQSSQIEQSVDVQKLILELFEASQHTTQQHRQDENEAKLLRTLASDYKSDKDSIPTRVAGTCEWVFEDKRFLEWRDSKKSSLLWIAAGPDGQEQRSKGANAISAILHQLFEKKSGSSLLTHALLSYKNYGEKLPDAFSELWDVLIKTARDLDAGEIVCVLDALDECEENARKQLVQKLVSYFADTDYLSSSSFRLKFLITSRPYEDLELGFQSISGTDAFIRFDGDEQSEKIGQEIHLVIDAKVPQIARSFSAEDRKSISDRLKKLDNRTYLWLHLTMNIIERSLSSFSKMSKIDKLLSGLPSSVSDAYQEILSRSTDEDTAKVLLQIVVAARRPLTLEEANIALSIATQKEGCKSHKTLELWPSTSFKSTIQNMCGLFISVYDSKLFLIHQTAREFLLCSSSSPSPSSRKWEGNLSMNMAHGLISQICLHYLNLQEFTRIHPQKLDWYEGVKKIKEMYPFLTYAAEEWPVHYTSQDSELAQSSREAAAMLCRPSLAQLSYWSRISYGLQRPLFSYRWTELGIATQLGLFHVVKGFLNEGADVKDVNGSYGTALQIASAEGHEKIVKMLLNNNEDVNVKSSIHGTALIAAAARGYEKIVEMLLDQNADINAESQNHGTALRAATVEGHEEIVEMLLNQNADINAKIVEHGPALVEAAGGGREKIVEMLLNRHAEVNAEEGKHPTALAAAAREGKENIVGMLLKHDADVNIKNGDFDTPLMAAVAGGSEKMVKVLLDSNADVNAKNRRGTALEKAAAEGYERIAELLLNQDADVNAKSDGFHGTALIAAAYEGHVEIAEMLLRQNADINAEGTNYDTALIAAAARGHEEMIEMLLSHNADVNAGRKHTALEEASAQGHEKAVEILLDRNTTAGKDAALGCAAAGGYDKVIEILLRRNPDIDFDGESYLNAVEKASYNVRVRTIEMLLDKMIDNNVDVDVYDNALEVALKAAASVKVLIFERDAEVRMLRERKRKLSAKYC